MKGICEDLRKSVLQAAIQGRLTQQLPEDGDAEALYAEIQKEKQKLIKEGKIKKEKPLPEITEDDIPFDIPENWKWVRLGEVFSVYGGKRVPVGKKWVDYDTGHKYIRVTDMKNGTISSSDTKYITEDVFQQIKKYTISKDDVYITVAGTIGRVGLVPDEFDKANLTENADKICIYKSDKYFVYYLLSSQEIQSQILEMVTQVGQPKLAILRIQNLTLPLPPLAEQKRIVARVDELMAKIDEMEKTEKDIKALYDAFPGDMKASLLQAAIQGKLTKQLESDGDAETLYADIQKEKQRLIKEGKIKKEKPLPEITEDDILFDIPENWKWVRFGEVVNIVSARRVHQSDWKTSGIPFYRAREIAKLAIDGHVDNDLFISKELYSKFSVSGVPLPGDLMVTAVGTLGKTYIVQPSDVFYYKDASVICLENRFGIDSQYLKYIMESDMLWQQISSNSAGTTVATLTMERMINYVIPLPPLAEQKRIVEKLDQLLPLCDSMKEAIDATA